MFGCPDEALSLVFDILLIVFNLGERNGFWCKLLGGWKKQGFKKSDNVMFLTCCYTPFHGLLKQFLGFCHLTSRISGKKQVAMVVAV